MSANSVLSLQHYAVKEMMFKLNETFHTQSTQIDLYPEFRKTVTKLDENTAAVDLIFSIEPTADAPFAMNVCIEGIFSLENWDCDKLRPLMEQNTAAILFPFLRSLVAVMTSNANIQSYILPVLNINELFAKQEHDCAKQEND